MIPRSFPSVINATTSEADMTVFFLSSVAGLREWIDYIPVKKVTVGTANRYSNDGFKTTNPLASITGLTAWIDYVPAFIDASKTIPWSTDAAGFIPVQDI
jgi:hypothetical protein